MSAQNIKQVTRRFVEMMILCASMLAAEQIVGTSHACDSRAMPGKQHNPVA